MCTLSFSSVAVRWSGILMAVIAAGCAAEAGRAAQAAPAPTLRELKNATYGGFDVVKTPITLKEGRWEGEPYAAGGASRPAVSFVSDFHVSGDLDGDRSEDAVVLLAESTGGSGENIYLAVVARRDNQLRAIGTARVGDRVQIRDLRIDGRDIVVDLVQAGAQDAACCPGELLTRRWQLGSAGLVEAQTLNKPARLTLETLAGTEWVLHAWNMNDATPAKPEVTLVLKDGKFAGGAGCNRYFAAAKLGEMPGDVTVGPAGATRMMCPPEQMIVEGRFLKQLAGVKKFGFMVGRLALSYETDGVWGVMLFDPRPYPSE
jgi:heat shock protein HslJ